MRGETEVRAMAAPWHRGVELRIRNQAGEVGRLVWWETEAPGAMPAATVAIEWDQAQTLMDDLWGAGLRPTEGSGSAGALAATQAHLADMRKLVFDQRMVTDR